MALELRSQLHHYCHLISIISEMLQCSSEVVINDVQKFEVDLSCICYVRLKRCGSSFPAKTMIADSQPPMRLSL